MNSAEIQRAVERSVDNARELWMRSGGDADEVALALPVRLEFLAGVPAKNARRSRELRLKPVDVPTEDLYAEEGQEPVSIASRSQWP
jgi:hypothetical protein